MANISKAERELRAANAKAANIRIKSEVAAKAPRECDIGSMQWDFAKRSRVEFLTVAAGAVDLVYAELRRKTNDVPWHAAVEEILAHANRRHARALVVNEYDDDDL